MPYLNGNLQQHIATMLEIFRLYAFSILWPFNVTTLPPLYCPPPGNLTLAHGIISLLILLLGLLAVMKWIKVKGTKLFFLLWFFVALIPTSNVIPLANPMAYRFLNLPAAGIIPFAVLTIYDFVDRRNIRNWPMLRLLTAGYILFCMAQTYLLNTAWKSPMIHAMNMARDHPRHPLPYLFLGIEYYRLGQRHRPRPCSRKE
jgi:hypothetical protein